MSNPFTNIINSTLKTTFNDAINAMLASDGLTLPCRLNFGVTKYESCDNCLYDPIGKKSSNFFMSGAPIPFRSGQTCPMCDGTGKRAVVTTETINLMVLWQYKDWIDIGAEIRSPEGMVQTISSIDTLPDIKRAKSVIIDTDIEKLVKHEFVRDGEPTPAGLGRDNFIVTMWSRIK